MAQPSSRSGIDRAAEFLARRIAAASSRRSLLARLGAWSVAAPLFPLLPVGRAQAAQPQAAQPQAAQPQAAHPRAPTPFGAAAQTTDETRCNYWRYCAIDGYLCTGCGGGLHSCPPGTTPSPTSWIGTCFNPADSRSYLVAYRDCCGQDACAQSMCLGTDGDEPAYRPQSNNDIIWCYGASSLMYNCSTAVIVGLAE